MEGDAIDMKELLDILNKVKPGIDYVNEKHLVSDELIDSLDVMTSLMWRFCRRMWCRRILSLWRRCGS